MDGEYGFHYREEGTIGSSRTENHSAQANAGTEVNLVIPNRYFH